MCWESFVPKWRGVVVVGRIVSCPGVVLVSVGGLWQRPGAAHGHCGRALRAPGVLHAGGDGGFALHEAFLRRVAGVSDPRVDPLGKKRPKPTVVAEWVCVLADSVSVVVCWLHVNR